MLWPFIRLWSGQSAIVGEVGIIEPPNRRPWFSYVVLPWNS
jgi:hypothetical protein